MLSNDCIEHAHLLRGDGLSIYYEVAVVAMVSGDHGARVDLSEVYGVAVVASVLIDLGDLIPARTLCLRTSSYYMNCCLQVMAVTFTKVLSRYPLSTCNSVSDRL